MAFKKMTGRQEILSAVVPILAADWQAGITLVPVADLPVGAILVGGGILVHTAFNSTTNSLDLGDAVDADRYTQAGVVDLKTPGFTAFDGEFLYYPNGVSITVDYVQTGAVPSAGLAYLVIEYVIVDRATEVQP